MKPARNYYKTGKKLPQRKTVQSLENTGKTDILILNYSILYNLLSLKLE